MEKKLKKNIYVCVWITLLYTWNYQFSLAAQSCPTLQPHGLQHTRLPCPSPTPGACSNSCSSGRWCHPTTSSSAVPFSSLFQSFPASGSFPMSQFFASGGQSMGVSASASVFPMNIQDWFPLELTGLITMLSMGLSSILQHHSSKAPVLQSSAFFVIQISHPYMITEKKHRLDYMEIFWQSNVSTF